MRPTPPGWDAAVANSHRPVVTVESWLDGRKLADVPVDSGSITYDATAKLARRVTLTVPLYGEGRDWTPNNPAVDPLGHFGQRLHVKAGLVMPDGSTAVMEQGWYLITDWSTSRAQGTISVTAADLGQLVLDALMGTDNCTAWGASAVTWIERPTYRMAMDFIMGGDDLGGMARPEGWRILPWATAQSAIDLVVGTNVVYLRDRWDTLVMLLDLIGCKPRVMDDGQLWVIPKVTTLGPPVKTVHEGPAGTVSASDLTGSRSAINNYVTVYGKNDPQTQASNPFRTDPWAWAWLDDGPLRSNGPFGPRNYVLENDGINENPPANTLARQLLAAGVADAWTRTAAIVPDPSLELDDVVTVQLRDGTMFTGSIVGMQVPLSYQGLMNIAVANKAPDATVKTREGGL